MTEYFLPADDAELVALRGFAREHARLVRLHEDPRYVGARDPAATRRVGVVSGGGSGHEPLHGGFVGRGMLDAAVPGRIFASPHNRQVFAASLEVARDEGVLHIVKNYTGDRINFGIAAERLRDQGIRTERVLVDDDIATESDETKTGRRGTAATVVVEKVVGAAAEEGLGLDALAEVGRQVASKARSVAVASRAHTAPAGGLAFDLAEGELEYGVGIHGERAAASVANDGVAQTVDRMLADLQAHTRGVDPGVGTVVLVNGLGSATSLELSAIAELACAGLERRGVEIADVVTGTLVPALDMRGFSLTLVPMDQQELARWQAPCETAAWRLA
jgi:dihydroxyacetone kinase